MFDIAPNLITLCTLQCNNTSTAPMERQTGFLMTPNKRIGIIDYSFVAILQHLTFDIAPNLLALRTFK